METTALIWALWVFAGGSVNSGYLKQPYIAAQFVSQRECERVQKILLNDKTTEWARCIQAEYFVGKQPEIKNTRPTW